MNTTHRIRMIVAIAVALTIAVAGIASASPPVPAPNGTSFIEGVLYVKIIGTFTEVETLDASWSDIPDTSDLFGAGYQYTDSEGKSVTRDVSNYDWDDDLAQEERVAQIQYEENVKAVEGCTEFWKVFKWDGCKAPNLWVDKRLGYNDDPLHPVHSAISWVDSTENVGMTIVTEGDDEGLGVGVGALCVFAQDVCVPPTNELVSAGSQLYMVDLVAATTKTSVTATESPRLAHRITAAGIPEGAFCGSGAFVDTVLGPAGTLDGPYGVGTISAGMKVQTMEGRGCDYRTNQSDPTTEYYPKAGDLTYEELTTAKGYWDFDKSMTYEAQIKDANIPRSWRVFNLPV